MDTALIPLLVASVALVGVVVNTLATVKQGSATRDHNWRLSHDARAETKRLAKESQDHARRLAQDVDKRERDFAGRRDWWTRFADAVKGLSSQTDHDKVVALLLLDALSGAPWVHEEDKLLTASVLQAYNEASLKGVLPPGGSE